MAKIYGVIQTKTESDSLRNAHMITDLPTKQHIYYISTITVTSISRTFTYKMAAKVN